MKAMLLDGPRPIDQAPLRLADMPTPEPAAGEILVRVEACGVCRTDLHTVEGELAPHKQPVVPGHQVVGQVERLGSGVDSFQLNDRVGIAWLRATCNRCEYCRRGSENLCSEARFTGWDADGGYAEYAVVRADYAYRLPRELEAQSAAPLLCAGIIGYRALRRSKLQPGQRLGIYGFGSSAHVVLEIARYWGCEVYVFTRQPHHRALAREMGASWVGESSDRPPHSFDSAIIFAPAGNLVPLALESLDRGGTLALAGIYMTPVPSLDYERHLFQERTVTSVTANTRADGREVIDLAARIPLRPRVQVFPLDAANRALLELKQDRIQGSAVLQVG